MPQETRLPLPLGPLEAWLAEAVPGFAGPVEAHQFSGGQSNPTYRLQGPGASYVLRRKPPGPLLPKAHMIEREHRVMDALGRAAFPVPRMLAYCADDTVIGSAFFVMEHVEGRVLYDARLPGLTVGERRQTCLALLDTLARLHRIDPAAVGLGDFGRPGGYLSRQVAIWTAQYDASATHAIPEMARLADWLPEAVTGIPDETCLVHGDYRLDNLILDATTTEIRAVLDWELSTLGHPLADLGYLLMTWVFPSDLRWGLAEADLDALGIPRLEALAERYAAATGRAEIVHLDTLLAYNVWRLAAILQGVYARGLAGNAADEAATTMGADVPRLAAIAWDLARRAGA
ncbi:MAG: phosphotransferase family protein [Pseudomonadota bacterium]